MKLAKLLALIGIGFGMLVSVFYDESLFGLITGEDAYDVEDDIFCP